MKDETKQEPKTEQELRVIIKEARLQLNKIEDEQRQTRNAALVGKCFKYRNSYIGSEEWWRYSRVVGIKHFFLIVFSFETDCHGRITIGPSDEAFDILPNSEEISAREFKREWKNLMDRMGKL